MMVIAHRFTILTELFITKQRDPAKAIFAIRNETKLESKKWREIFHKSIITKTKIVVEFQVNSKDPKALEKKSIAWLGLAHSKDKRISSFVVRMYNLARNKRALFMYLFKYFSFFFLSFFSDELIGIKPNVNVWHVICECCVRLRLQAMLSHHSTNNNVEASTSGMCDNEWNK